MATKMSLEEASKAMREAMREADTVGALLPHAAWLAGVAVRSGCGHASTGDQSWLLIFAWMLVERDVGITDR
jgi:hypothetical protein